MRPSVAISARKLRRLPWYVDHADASAPCPCIGTATIVTTAGTATTATMAVTVDIAAIDAGNYATEPFRASFLFACARDRGGEDDNRRISSTGNASASANNRVVCPCPLWFAMNGQ